MLLKTDLRDPFREGDCVRFAHHLHPWETAGGSGRYGDYPVKLSRRLLPGANRYNNDLAKVDTGPGAGDGFPCTLSIPESWAGLTIHEIEKK